jgi:glycosidase
MQWDGSETAGFTSGTPWEPLARNRDAADVATQTADATSLLNHYRALIQLRNAHPALRTGDMTLVESSSPTVMAYLRHEGEEALLVLVNLDNEPLSDYALTLAEGPLAAVTTTTLLMGNGEAAVPTMNAAGGFDAYTPLSTLPPRSTTIIQLLP